MPTTDNCNADALANELFVSLTQDAPIPPSVDLTSPKFNFDADLDSELYKAITSVGMEELTEVSLEGEGVFDKMMAAVDLHIQREFKNNRITGSQYAEVYTAVVNEVLSKATQFVLSKDSAKWAAITAQMQARVAQIEATAALVNLERTKAETLKTIFDMQNSGAQFALTKMQIANADATHCQIKAQTAGDLFKAQYLMPAELAIQEYQRMQVLPSTVAINHVQSDRILPAEAAIKEFQNRELQPVERDLQKYELETTNPIKTAVEQFNLDRMLPVQLGKEQHLLNFQLPAQTKLITEQGETARAQTLDTRSDNITLVKGIMGKQKEAIVIDIATKQFQLDFALPVQLDMIKEQREGERSKTLDTRTDGVVVKGSVGKQKELYTQQIDSFIKDSQHKVAKMYLDTWITQKTLDEDLPVPTELNNSNIGSVVSAIRNNNDL